MQNIFLDINLIGQKCSWSIIRNVRNCHNKRKLNIWTYWTLIFFRPSITKWKFYPTPLHLYLDPNIWLKLPNIPFYIKLNSRHFHLFQTFPETFVPHHFKKHSEKIQRVSAFVESFVERNLLFLINVAILFFSYQNWLLLVIFTGIILNCTFRWVLLVIVTGIVLSCTFRWVYLFPKSKSLIGAFRVCHGYRNIVT